MTHRELDILHSLVESYIQTGEPVASRTIAKQRRDNLSAATIRNTMADLCDSGYLSQPHTSAGRIPTEKAFRSYVQSLARGRLLLAELQRVRGELSQMNSMEARVEWSSRMLMEMTRGVGIAAAIPTSSQTLDQIELIGLSDRRVLMIVVTAIAWCTIAWFHSMRPLRKTSWLRSAITSIAISAAGCFPIFTTS